MGRAAALAIGVVNLAGREAGGGEAVQARGRGVGDVRGDHEGRDAVQEEGEGRSAGAARVELARPDCRS
jgi:hypothetical protein